MHCVFSVTFSPQAQARNAEPNLPSRLFGKRRAPQAQYEKKPLQNRPVHKRLAHVGWGRRLLGAEQQQTDRQTAGMPTRQPLMKSSVLVRSTKACMARNNALQCLILTGRKHTAEHTTPHITVSVDACFFSCWKTRPFQFISSSFSSCLSGCGRQSSLAGAPVSLHPL